MPRSFDEMPLGWVDRILLHPRHQQLAVDLVQLITTLRQCRSYADYYEFQQDLLARVLDVHEHRHRSRGALRRLQQGKSVPDYAPDLPAGSPSNLRESWELEIDVCERVDRQLRSIADALAWRVLDYDRRIVIAFSRKQHPGLLNKDGLDAELEFATERWREKGQFVLLNDLTMCLRTGDAISFTEVDDGFEACLHEIKTDPNRKVSKQRRHQRMAEEAVRSGGPLPGDLPGRLVPVAIPYRAHLDLLGRAFDLAHERGVQGIKVPGGRAVVVVNLARAHDLWTEQEFTDEFAAEHLRAVRRARIADAADLVIARSDDIVGRVPTMPPWAIYPLSPGLCARLITDQAMYLVTMSGSALVAALADLGVPAEWVLPGGLEQIEPDRVVLRAYSAERRIELRWAEVRGRLLLELADLSVWAESVVKLLASNLTGRHPWQSFTDEWKVWA